MNMIIADRKKIHQAVVIIFFILLCFTLYLNSLNGEFVLDAHYVIVQNPLIQQPGLSAEIFTKGYFDTYKGYSQLSLNYYRPLAILSFALDYKLWGLNPLGYRLTNVCIHFFNCLLAGYLIYILFKNRQLSFLSSLFFCILPVHEWVINDIVGRGDLLESFFALSAMICLAVFLKERKPATLLLSLFFYLLAILSRETMVILPLFMGVISFYFLRDFKKAALVLFPFLSVGVDYYSLRFWLFPISHDSLINLLGWQNLFGWSITALEYSFRYLLPWSVLSFFPELIRGPYVTAFFVLCTIIFLIVYFIRAGDTPKKEQFLLGSTWVVLGMLPLLLTKDVLSNLGPYLSEYVLYFPSIGFAIIIGTLILELKDNFQKLAITILALFYITVTVFNNAHWTTEQALLMRAQSLEHSDRYISTRQLLLRYETNIGKLQKLLVATNHPSFKSIYLKRIGAIHRTEKQYEKAVGFLKDAVATNPANLEARQELSLVYFESGDNQKAKEEIRRILQIDRGIPSANRLLGVIFYQEGNYESAISYLKTALHFQPRDMPTFLLLAMSYFFNDQEEEYRRLIDGIGVKSMDMHFALRFIGGELYRHRYFQNAISLFEKTKELFPKDSEAVALLGWSYYYLGKPQSALGLWREALSLDSKQSLAKKGLEAIEEKGNSQ